MYDKIQEARDPDRLKGRPIAVVQYNPYGDLATIGPDEDRLMNHSNGSLIAVNYVAKGYGVKRNQRGAEARNLCPELQLVQVPTAHGKADLTLYRTAGKRVLEILGKDGVVCERASIDECYLDLTEKAHERLQACGGHLPLFTEEDNLSSLLRDHHVYGPMGEIPSAVEWFRRPPEAWEAGELLLAAGSIIVKELRDLVWSKLGYTCSSGIAHTRLLAKLCSGLHKPSQQTIIPANAVARLLEPLPVFKLKGLGGQFGGQVCSDLKVQTVGELAECSIARLTSLYGEKSGRWVYNLARGIDDGEVAARRVPKSISCGKTFRGNTALTCFDAVLKWLTELAGELEDRISEDTEENARVPTLLTVSMRTEQGSVSRSCHLRRVQVQTMSADALGLVKRSINENQGKSWKIVDLYLGVSNFIPVQTNSIKDFFRPKTIEMDEYRASDASESRDVQHRGNCTENNAEGKGSGEVADVMDRGRPEPNIDAWQVEGDIVKADHANESITKDQTDEISMFGLEQHGIDAAVLAELPPSIQRELKAQIQMEAMTRKFQERSTGLRERCQGSNRDLNDRQASNRSGVTGDIGGLKEGGQSSDKRHASTSKQTRKTSTLDSFLSRKRNKR